ncbi:U2 small nuclear ribonucleoprotein auxiliary factor 35 kDa subunit-related protein 1-like isoform X6 [Portunus trituberculatus]|uniref:U2 small nuclear ribonucleoprotein auxiliary factor 35 kDa subunit-related protein 1-like isoform X6 n=1 Tax=Portunus trituberculatus TaxID=210409 RepID=UPI001E1D0149|nr:U2 small nuclear ribonucleoprotein auxiliary factor 35 kDa subunit-related protein 1-like isoform X6 [Portunus trituberculatus]
MAAGVRLPLRWLAWKTSPPLIAAGKSHVSLGGVNGVHGSKCPMLKKKKCGQDSWLLHHCITMLIELTKRVSHKVWRQIVKRERRRRIRQKTAQELHLKHQEEQAALMQDPSYREELERLWIMEEETWRLEEEEAHRRKEEWQLRDAALHSKFLNEKCKREFQEEQKKKQEEMIKKEWEEKQKMEEEDKKKKEQEALLKAATDSLGKQGEQPTHNPEPPVGYNRRDLTPPRREPCPFFNKTGTCRFGVQCSRDHVYPERSSTILLPNMYTYFGMEHLAVEEKDSDIGLEYSESEIYQHFRDFFEDVLPEFQRCGKVLQFKVCSNASPHLRGNVYVQFLSEEDAGRACALFNGRWYAGRQLTCYLVTIEKWKSALCEILAMLSGRQTRTCNLLQIPAKQLTARCHQARAPDQGMRGPVKHQVIEDKVSTTMKTIDMKELLLFYQRICFIDQGLRGEVHYRGQTNQKVVGGQADQKDSLVEWTRQIDHTCQAVNQTHQGIDQEDQGASQGQEINHSQEVNQ